MRLDVKAMAFALGIVSAVAVLLTGLANLVWPGYAGQFLQLLASVYPGYKASGSLRDLVTGVVYALVDGALFGLVFAWIYNRFRGEQTAVSSRVKQEAGVTYPPVEPRS
jgi:hypothetical protein